MRYGLVHLYVGKVGVNVDQDEGLEGRSPTESNKTAPYSLSSSNQPSAL